MRRARIELDFIVAPRRSVWLGLLLLTVALGVAADLVLRLQNARNELSSIEATHDLLSAERPPARRLPVERLEEQVVATQTVVRQLTLPWATLIETLEDSAAQDVAVLQVQPDAQQGLLRIAAEARTYGAMLQYLRNLSSGDAFSDVHLLSHQVQLDDPQKPLRFSVQATIKAAP